MQLVQVAFDRSPNRTYTYAWPHTDDAVELVVGDRVVVPPSAFNEDPKFASVLILGSTYKGPTKPLMAVLDKKGLTGMFGPDGEPVDV